MKTHIDIWVRKNYILVECYYVGGVIVMQYHDWNEVIVNTSFDMSRYETIRIWGKEL